MKTKRSLSFFMSLCLLLCSNLVAASVSTVLDDKLIIPRIDLDGSGAMEFTFQIVNDGNWYFILESSKESSLSIANSGEFDPVTGVMDLYEVALSNGDSYSVQLQLDLEFENTVFQLKEAILVSSIKKSPLPVSNPTPIPGADTFEAKCANCHGDVGAGTGAGPSLLACATCTDATTLSIYIRDTMPIGQASSCDFSCANELAAYILSVLNSENANVTGKTIGFIQTLSATSTLRKASMQLLSRLPSGQEFQLATSSDDGLSQAIDTLMEEDAFYQRLSEIFNDYFLTDKYLSSNGSEAAISLLDRDKYLDRRWFDPDKDDRAENYSSERQKTNDGIAREPLELINYVVRNDLPFTEIVTADYLMVNPWSAKSYGLGNVNFRNPDDENEFQPARIDGIPHAGILTSTMFLNRYPTTSTNRNRGRARVIFDIFLDTDILAIEGVRPGNAVDITTAIPTLDNPKCSKCHSVIDPVASVFQNWQSRGQYRPVRLERYGWYSDMDLRGFNGVVMPLAGNVDSSVQWLGHRIAEDPRFPKAMVRMLVNGLTGKEPLRAPAEASATEQEMDAYIAERTLLNEMQVKFVGDNHNLKTLIREILLSPYWRASGLTVDANSLAHANTGSSSLLTPEMLHRKIKALLGFEWRGRMDYYYKDINKSYSAKLIHKNSYQQIYGGIDSDNVTRRLTTPNGLMGAVQFRMANELACYAVPQEFMLPREERRLFPYVEKNTSPFGDDGIDSEAMQNIRQNIQYLHSYLLNENLSLQSEELLITERLFMGALEKGEAYMEENEHSWGVIRLPSYCQRNNDLDGNPLYVEEGDDKRVRLDREYIMRAWMSVIAYLLADYRFLYE